MHRRAGAKMHRRAGAIMHQGEPSEGDAGEASRGIGSGLGCLARLRGVADASRSTLALFEPIAVAVHLEDIDMMGQPVE